ncbi:MAG: tRNA (adenosine(37)-N6)-threonylcarbamoyltransferase complex transferase subunit TsaD [Verrucomicrobiae bacterium]|nr:tRNA (adenosine(37)-N6)-threonylcarbamoyltransferase complex transferase subunit TsaD [Verrucomicrobiae bacterium]
MPGPTICFGVETSCDETAAAVVALDGGRPRILASVVASQAGRHAAYGGVVPELATREHLRALDWVTDEAMRSGGVAWRDITVVTATRGPGLASALMTGHSFARAVAIAAGKPFLGSNHLEGHLVSAFLDPGAPPMPDVGEWLALVVSGGHTLLAIGRSDGTHEVIGSTLDDAAGEAFDKGAKMLGLGYPGGSALEAAARHGDPSAYDFPRGMLRSGDLSFSFSGLKTALRILLGKRFGGTAPAGKALADLCASYQRAIVDVLAAKATMALRQTGLRTLVLAGGVACNAALRAALAEACGRDGIRLLAARPEHCTDNAAMIALAAAWRHAASGAVSPWDEDVDPNLGLAPAGQKV